MHIIFSAIAGAMAWVSVTTATAQETEPPTRTIAAMKVSFDVAKQVYPTKDWGRLQAIAANDDLYVLWTLTAEFDHPPGYLAFAPEADKPTADEAVFLADFLPPSETFRRVTPRKTPELFTSQDGLILLPFDQKFRLDSDQAATLRQSIAENEALPAEVKDVLQQLPSRPVQAVWRLPEYARRTLNELVPVMPDDLGGMSTEVIGREVDWMAASFDPASGGLHLAMKPLAGVKDPRATAKHLLSFMTQFFDSPRMERWLPAVGLERFRPLLNLNATKLLDGERVSIDARGIVTIDSSSTADPSAGTR